MSLLAFCLAVALMTAPEPVSEPDSPIDRVIAAYGGTDLWAPVETIRHVGSVSPTMRTRGGALVRELRRNGRLRVAIDYGDSTEVREVDGDRGTRDGEPVSGPQLQAMILQAARMDIPMILHDRRAAVIDHGLVDRGNATFRRLEVPLPGSLSLTLEIDPKTWRVMRSAGTLPLPNGMPMSFETDYSDFRWVDGRLFAFREVNIVGGTVTGETVLERVEVTLRGQQT